MGLHLPTPIRSSYQRWMVDEKGWSRNTRRHRIDTIETFAAFCSAQRLTIHSATRQTVLAFIGQTGHPRTRNLYLGAIRVFYQFAIEANLEDRDPTAGIQRVREPRGLPRPLTRGQAKALLDCARVVSPRAQVVVVLLLFSGLRREEAASLMWSDIDLDTGVLRVTHGKGDKTRLVPMPAILVEALAVWRIREKSPVWVFPSPVRQGEHVNAATLWRDVREAADAAHLKGVTPHRLRHSYATETLKLEHDVTQIQALLGHASLASTQIYTKVETSDLAKVVSRLNYDP
jgi:integrase/recombinase XerD